MLGFQDLLVNGTRKLLAVTELVSSEGRQGRREHINEACNYRVGSAKKEI